MRIVRAYVAVRDRDASTHASFPQVFEMSLRSRASAVLVIALFTAPSAVSVRAQAIEGLGHTHPFAMSYDGSVVVGIEYSASSGDYVVYRWEVGEGSMLIEGAIGTDSESVSGDGTVLLGSTKTSDEDQFGTAFKWTDGEMTLLPSLNFAGPANYDGSVIAGGKRSDDGDWEAVVDGGANYGVGLITGIDSAGTNMVGYVVVDGVARARIWPAGTDLGEGVARAISPDGNTVIGSRPDGTSFRWTRSGGLDLLIPGVAVDMTRDGTTIVGSAGVPFIWTEADGTRPLSDFLSEQGVVLEGWQIGWVRLISEDGNVLVGGGTNPQGEPEGWRVQLCGAINDWESDSGGDFSSEEDWSGEAVPDSFEVARFGLGETYTVNLSEDVYNDRLEVTGDSLTLNLGGSTYTLSGSCGTTSVTIDGAQLVLGGETGVGKVSNAAGGTMLSVRGTEVKGNRGRLVVDGGNRYVVDSDEDGNGDLIVYGTAGVPANVEVVAGGVMISNATSIFGPTYGSGGLTISGSGSRFEGDVLIIGQKNGTLEASDGAELTANVLVLSGEEDFSDSNARILSGAIVRVKTHLTMAVGEGWNAQTNFNAALEIRGSGSTLIVESGDPLIGEMGNASVFVTDDGAFETRGTLILGQQGEAFGQLSIDRGEVTANGLVVGERGKGEVRLLSGLLNPNWTWIGGRSGGAGADGEMLIDGPNSTLRSRLGLTVGKGGRGILRVQNQATVEAYRIDLYASSCGGGIPCSGIIGVADVPIVVGPTPGKNSVNSGHGIRTDSLFIYGEGVVVEADTIILNESGVLGGTGPFSFPIVNVGTITPADTGGAAGAFRAGASYTQTTTGRLEIDVAGTADGQYDRLEVDGPATLAGALRIRIDDETFSPQVGDRFEIVRASQVEGTFDEVNAWPYRVALTYSATTITAELTSLVSSEEEADREELPFDYALEQNYPNPFNPSTEIAFSLPESGPARLVLYDLLGQELAVLVDGAVAAGTHRIRFDAAGLPSGVYLYRIEAGAFSRTRRMVLMQ